MATEPLFRYTFILDDDKGHPAYVDARTFSEALAMCEPEYGVPPKRLVDIMCLGVGGAYRVC